MFTIKKKEKAFVCLYSFHYAGICAMVKVVFWTIMVEINVLNDTNTQLRARSSRYVGGNSIPQICESPNDATGDKGQCT